MSIFSSFNRDTPEEKISALVDEVKRSPEQRDVLVSLLGEQNSFYAGRSANETIRIRGYILAAFAQTGLPAAALPFVLEELESGRDAYLVAAAAKALRGLDTPTSEVVPFLIKAVNNIQYADDALTFEQYKPQWPLAHFTTALTEIFQTLGWLADHAGTALSDLEMLATGRRGEFSPQVRTEIDAAIKLIRAAAAARPHNYTPITLNLDMSRRTSAMGVSASGTIADVELEDQDGNYLTYGAFFRGRPTILVFFYTRCNNPNKCSLTIYKLANLQSAIKAQRLEGLIQTAAMTYDPEYDVSARLKVYGERRGVRFSQGDRMLRARAGFHKILKRFQLGVNFTGTTVNRHRIELFIVDSHGEIAVTYSRLQWDVNEVLDRARSLLNHEQGTS